MNIQTLKNVENTPTFILDHEKLEDNLKKLKHLKDRTGIKILLAQKAFSMYATYPLIAQYLDGTTSSGINELTLAFKHMPTNEQNGQNNENDKKSLQHHIFAPAYSDSDFAKILEMSSHISFNSLAQWEKYRPLILERNRLEKNQGKNPSQNPAQNGFINCSLRLNLECSAVETAIYDPCGKGSRLGIKKSTLLDWIKAEIEKHPDQNPLIGINGLHFHTMCQQKTDVLEMMFDAFERYAEGLNELDPRLLKGIKTLNIGGGQHFTAEDYDTETAISLINRLQEKYNLQIIAEPGEAVALNAGYLVASVMDIVENDIEIAILDTSAACHMPDVLEMPYTPPVFGAYSPVVAYAENINAELLREDIPDIGNNVQKNSPQNPEKNLENSSFSSPETLRKLHPYRLAGNTCLAGDVIGDYAFEDVLQVGSRVVFGDMAIYSMVKTNTFNGINLPDIAVLENGEIKVLKSFSYQDFENRL